MKTYRSFVDFAPPSQGTVVSVGNFDGVHLGHQAIFQRARSLGSDAGMPLVVLTFVPAPVKLLCPDRAPRLLTPLPLKLKLLAQYGVDQVVVLPVTAEFLSLTPEQFARDILVQRLGAKHVVEGQTFAFGRRREGTMICMQSLGRRFGFAAHLVPARTVSFNDGQPVAVNSSLIRRYVATNRFDRARRALGHDHVFAGRIVPGRGRGRQLGFPTANLQPYSDDQLVPPDGVFAAYARLGRDLDEAWCHWRYYPAAVSIGRSPTLPGTPWQIEAHLLDFEPDDPDLYHRHVMLSLVQHLRPQERFATLKDLAQQIERDCRRVRRVLQNIKPESL